MEKEGGRGDTEGGLVGLGKVGGEGGVHVAGEEGVIGISEI